MYSVVLVEDDPFVRQGLKKLIDWEKLNMRIAGEANNGKEAVALIRRCQPDIVLTDISMPVMNGIQLLEALQEESPSMPQFIIISGYNDFHYAQSALRYGVHDFLLKPVDKDELHHTLQRLTAKMEQKRKEASHADYQRDETGFARVLNSQFEPETLNRWAAALPRFDHRSLWYYVVLEINNLHLPETSLQLNQGMLTEQVLKVFSQGGDQLVNVHPLSMGRMGLIVASPPNQKQGLRERLQQVLKNLQELNALELTLYVSRGVAGPHELAAAYESACQTMAHQFACPHQHVLLWDELEGQRLSYRDLSAQWLNVLSEQVEENQREEISETVSRFFREMSTQKLAKETVRLCVWQCVRHIAEVIHHMDGDEQTLASLPVLMSALDGQVTYRELRRLYEQFMLEAAALIEQLRTRRQRGEIEKIKRYIDQHYDQQISLKQIAQRFYLNPIYLGQLFKKTYGCYFKEYLLSRRISEAKRLLRQSDLKVYEIAEQVGFKSVDYFVTKFEACEGCTPTAYRNRLQSSRTRIQSAK